MTAPEVSVYAERYPAGVVCFALGHMGLSYALGAMIMYQLHPTLSLVYVGSCVAMIGVCLFYRCRFCWYFDKACYAGLGKIAGQLFSRGKPQDFAKPRNLLPAALFSFSVLLLPFVVIAGFSIAAFSLLNLLLLSSYLLLVVVPGFALRKSFFCDHCQQGKLGCPAYAGMQGHGHTKQNAPTSSAQSQSGK
jgi:hypothetical protein